MTGNASFYLIYTNFCFFSPGVEELWSGITFDYVEETLSWESACRVNVVISLCELQDKGVCKDLANSSQTYAKGMVSACIKYIKALKNNK